MIDVAIQCPGHEAPEALKVPESYFSTTRKGLNGMFEGSIPCGADGEAKYPLKVKLRANNGSITVDRLDLN